jgi:hypothetical protein
MRLRSAAPFAFALAGLLTACGGGGGSAPSTPSVTPGTGAAPVASPTAPAASNVRQSVGTGRLTLKLPPALRANNKIVRASNADTRKLIASNRRPQYINPLPNPTAGAYPYNVLDIYVDNTLVANLDGNFPSNDHSMLVVDQTGDGTQTLSVPLYSSTHNDIVAIEWDDAGATVPLALGEYQASGQLCAGCTVNLSMTMLMQAFYTGIVDLPNLSSPSVLIGTNHNLGACGAPLSSNAFALYSADAELSFVPIAGYGGTSTPTITSVNQLVGGGTTKISQSAAGTYYIVWDANCDPVQLWANAPVPANAIWQDIQANYTTYYYAYFYGWYGGIGGQYQGVWNLQYIFGTFPTSYQWMNLTGTQNWGSPYINIYPIPL